MQNTLDTLPTKPLLTECVNRLLALYGSNQIIIPLTPILVKLFREVFYHYCRIHPDSIPILYLPSI